MDMRISDGYVGWFDWAYKGVNHTLPGNGGPECRDFLSLTQRCVETLFALVVSFYALISGFSRLSFQTSTPCPKTKTEQGGKMFLLVLLCLTFGIELGFKLVTRQMIWIFNPCHIATIMQIYMLAAPPSRKITALFRLNIHMLSGVLIAILFPVTNTRVLPFESGVYYLQHILLLVIPVYLIKFGDPFIPEEVMDFSWSLFSVGVIFLYHFLPLQFLAYVSQSNLNNMLCPAVSDPFHGQYYRIFAIVYQFILISCHGKVFVIIAKALIPSPCDSHRDECPITETQDRNGHVKVQ